MPACAGGFRKWISGEQQESFVPGTQTACSRLVGKSSGPECMLQGALGFECHYEFEHPPLVLEVGCVVATDPLQVGMGRCRKLH